MAGSGPPRYPGTGVWKERDPSGPALRPKAGPIEDERQINRQGS